MTLPITSAAALILARSSLVHCPRLPASKNSRSGRRARTECTSRTLAGRGRSAKRARPAGAEVVVHKDGPPVPRKMHELTERIVSCAPGLLARTVVSVGRRHSGRLPASPKTERHPGIFDAYPPGRIQLSTDGPGQVRVEGQRPPRHAGHLGTSRAATDIEFCATRTCARRDGMPSPTRAAWLVAMPRALRSASFVPASAIALQLYAWV